MNFTVNPNLPATKSRWKAHNSLETYWLPRVEETASSHMWCPLPLYPQTQRSCNSVHLNFHSDLNAKKEKHTRLLVIYTLPSNTTNLLNLPLHMLCLRAMYKLLLLWQHNGMNCITLTTYGVQWKDHLQKSYFTRGLHYTKEQSTDDSVFCVICMGWGAGLPISHSLLGKTIGKNTYNG